MLRQKLSNILHCTVSDTASGTGRTENFNPITLWYEPPSPPYMDRNLAVLNMTRLPEIDMSRNGPAKDRLPSVEPVQERTLTGTDLSKEGPFQSQTCPGMHCRKSRPIFRDIRRSVDDL